MLSKDELAFFQQQLLQAKEKLEERLKDNNHFGLERSHAHDSTGELASYDNHPADEGTELYEREKDIALYDHAERELANIHRALQAIKNGTYGRCERCGEPIPYERLEALPTTTFCKEHSREQAVSQKRPLEEGVLFPPFGKFDFDDRDAAMYDAEDAWQEVARYGTSDTPSDVWRHVDHYNETYAEADEPVGYVEAFENFAAVDLYGHPLPLYPTREHEQLEERLDREKLTSTIGDLPAYEKEPYTEAKARTQDHP
ncbi:yteA family sporulation protein [Anoxybacteroides amylolyticum]|uniref:Regulatory, yteA family protein n=1 Tax=Anoxybacteroides amylolyticum TaxID=294699 RepID=A0A160F691_9BACL|nr:yteA family sporulation protein [Anoxybacillus amylolyticus]ANB62117.1 regulatory, yteA family protein [Anoxybacillus amylolyticus]